MVEVANKKAANPLQTVSQQLDIALPVIDMLDLPVKLVWGKMMIGLGDIVRFNSTTHLLPIFLTWSNTQIQRLSMFASNLQVVPGVLLVFTLKYDKQQGIAPLRGYYAGTFCGYGLGLITTIVSDLLTSSF